MAASHVAPNRNRGVGRKEEGVGVRMDQFLNADDSVVPVYFLPYVDSVIVDPVTMRTELTVIVALHWPVPGIEDLIVHSCDEEGGEYYELKAGVVVANDDGDPRISDEHTGAIFWPNLVLDKTEQGVPLCKGIDIYRPEEFSGPQDLHFYAKFKFESATVNHPMDLRAFPFDRQCITYYFMLDEQPSTLAMLELHCPQHIFDCMSTLGEDADSEVDTSHIEGARLVPDLTAEDWSDVMHEHDLITDKQRFEWQSGHAPIFSNMELRFDMIRETHYFMTKVVIVVYVLLLMGTGVFIMPNDFQSRGEQILTLFLTGVAFQYAVAGMVPQLSYSTHIDNLILFMYLALFSCGAQSYFLHLYVADTSPEAKMLVQDKYCICLYLLVVHGYFGYFLYWGYENVAEADPDYSELFTNTVNECMPQTAKRLSGDELVRLAAQCVRVPKEDVLQEDENGDE